MISVDNSPRCGVVILVVKYYCCCDVKRRGREGEEEGRKGSNNYTVRLRLTCNIEVSTVLLSGTSTGLLSGTNLLLFNDVIP